MAVGRGGEKDEQLGRDWAGRGGRSDNERPVQRDEHERVAWTVSRRPSGELIGCGQSGQLARQAQSDPRLLQLSAVCHSLRELSRADLSCTVTALLGVCEAQASQSDAQRMSCWVSGGAEELRLEPSAAGEHVLSSAVTAGTGSSVASSPFSAASIGRPLRLEQQLNGCEDAGRRLPHRCHLSLVLSLEAVASSASCRTGRTAQTGHLRAAEVLSWAELCCATPSADSAPRSVGQSARRRMTGGEAVLEVWRQPRPLPSARMRTRASINRSEGCGGRWAQLVDGREGASTARRSPAAGKHVDARRGGCLPRSNRAAVLQLQPAASRSTAEVEPAVWMSVLARVLTPQTPH